MTDVVQIITREASHHNSRGGYLAEDFTITQIGTLVIHTEVVSDPTASSRLWLQVSYTRVTRGADTFKRFTQSAFWWTRYDRFFTILSLQMTAHQRWHGLDLNHTPTFNNGQTQSSPLISSPIPNATYQHPLNFNFYFNYGITGIGYITFDFVARHDFDTQNFAFSRRVQFMMNFL